MEIDLLVSNQRTVVAIEVKSTLRVGDIDEHLDRLADFKAVFWQYADMTVYGAVAGVDLRKNAARYAYQKGLFVLAPAGETMAILNDDKFKPTVW
jgi:hypothetical protein